VIVFVIVIVLKKESKHERGVGLLAKEKTTIFVAR
jgi:hypothetical protein